MWILFVIIFFYTKSCLSTKGGYPHIAIKLSQIELCSAKRPHDDWPPPVRFQPAWRQNKLADDSAYNFGPHVISWFKGGVYLSFATVIIASCCRTSYWYGSYSLSFATSNSKRAKSRHHRVVLQVLHYTNCLKWAIKTQANLKHSDLFPLNLNNTRQTNMFIKLFCRGNNYTKVLSQAWSEPSISIINKLTYKLHM